MAISLVRAEEKELVTPNGGDDGECAELFASVDAAIAYAGKTLGRETQSAAPPAGERDPLLYDFDWDEDSRLSEWRSAVANTRELPPTLAAALAAKA